jgi:molybdenum cofactor biosynthesis protein B
MGVDEHRTKAGDVGPIAFAVLTVSDRRTEATDSSGRLVRQLVSEAGHSVADAEIIPNEPQRIRASVRRLLQGSAECVVITGGTGAGRRDVTIETIAPLVEKTLPGFGELFRSLSYAEIGTAAMLSRALCGVVGGKVICCLPGSEAAVRLGVGKLLVPELAHLLWVLRQ